MRYVVFTLLYITIGIGITAAAEARSGKPVGESQVNMAIMLWPGTIAAIAYTKWTEPESSCAKGMAL